MNQRVFVLSGIILLSSVMINDAYAYIDPGTSSMLLQVLVGAIVGAGITIKVYWEKIKFRIINARKK